MENLKEQIMQMARNKGICADGYAFLRGLNLERMITYYLSNPDWCMERDFPDLHTLVERFSDCKDRGIYINEILNNESCQDLQVYVFHNCRGEIKVGLNVEKAIIPMLYFGNNCDIKIICDQDNGNNPINIPIYTFGKNKIKTKGKCANFIMYKNKML